MFQSFLAPPLRLWLRAYASVDRALCGFSPMGPALYVGQRPYRGPPRVLGGSPLDPGDPIGILHLNNSSVAATRRNAGNAFPFVRMLVASLSELALYVAQDPRWKNIHVFRGVTWLSPHGERLGFEVEPYPDTVKARLLRWHYHTLFYAFHPEGRCTGLPDFGPRVFWLTRARLFSLYAPDGKKVLFRLATSKLSGPILIKENTP